MISEEILTVCNSVRKWAEQYQKESIKKDIYYWEGLGGMCAIVSAELHKELKKININTEIVVNQTPWHCFCVHIDSKKVIDLTATQFGIKEKIHLCNTKDTFKVHGNIRDCWNCNFAFTNVKDFVKWQYEAD